MLSAALLCLVVGISDGDTLTARCPTQDAVHPYQQVKVRIHAIDAPESRQDFGQRSKESLSDLCFKTWAKIKHEDTDRYGRTVASVECRGKDVAAHQVSEGMAWVYTRYAKNRPDLVPLEQRARAAKIGLWSMDAVPPWEWRAKRRSGF